MNYLPPDGKPADTVKVSIRGVGLLAYRRADDDPKMWRYEPIRAFGTGPKPPISSKDLAKRIADAITAE